LDVRLRLFVRVVFWVLSQSLEDDKVVQRDSAITHSFAKGGEKVVDLLDGDFGGLSGENLLQNSTNSQRGLTWSLT
jgi:hypothetical protein